MSININYLMRHISRQLHTFIRRLSFEGTLLESVCERVAFQDAFTFSFPSLTNSLLNEMLLQIPHEQVPVIFTEGHFVSYALVSVPFNLFLIGPVILPSSAVHHYSLPEQSYDKTWLDTLYHCETADFIDMLLLLHNLFSTVSLSEYDIMQFNYIDEHTTHNIQKNFLNIMFKNQEYTTRHNPYDQEVREVASIRNGDIEQLRKTWSEDYLGSIGILANNPLRDNQNLAIVLVTLASRAAIEGGLLPETAYSLSDTYIRQIEEATTPDMALALGKRSEYQYAQMVHDLKIPKASSSLKKADPDARISKCKDYIFAHFHEKISITDIAGELYINPNYLSTIFKKHTGVTIGNYILNEKVNLAKNLLIYSRYSFIEIAAYLGFSSQSHLGMQFKKIVGMTLRQYREKYGVKEFL